MQCWLVVAAQLPAAVVSVPVGRYAKQAPTRLAMLEPSFDQAPANPEALGFAGFLPPGAGKAIFARFGFGTR